MTDTTEERPADTHRVTNPANGWHWDFPSKASAEKFARDAGLDVDVEEL